jgi:hypothetical protein
MEKAKTKKVVGWQWGIVLHGGRSFYSCFPDGTIWHVDKMLPFLSTSLTKDVCTSAQRGEISPIFPGLIKKIKTK